MRDIKAIFLDVDGKLTYCGSGTADSEGIDQEKVKLLKRIVDETGAVIILSSSWKYGYDRISGEKQHFYRVLEEQLDKCGLKIFDITPDISVEFDGDVDQRITETTLENLHHLKVKHGTGRAAEVQKWIKENAPDKFVILDDEDYDWAEYGFADNWIQPCWFDINGGLNDDHVKRAIEILSKL